MVAISELLHGCLAQFTSLINSNDLSIHIEVPIHEWKDELGRLRVWAANIGAHQTRQASLDYRLRDASHIKSQIIKLLERVQELLSDLKEVLEEQCDNQIQETAFEEMGDDPEQDSESLISEIQEIHQGLVETITHLYQISMIVRKPAHHDRLTGTRKLDAEPFQFWAKQHTSSKYPHADKLAIDRISSAMARQRAILKYRERHHIKLSQGIDLANDGKSTMLSETVATEVFKEVDGQSTDMISDAGVSETSYGGTLLEGMSSDGPKIPSIPREGADQSPFECPYCFYIITAQNKRAWARHIFRDLMPYVCIFPGCSTPSKLYESRRQWYHHIQKAHDLESKNDGKFDCSICRTSSLPTATFQRHVGQHLEELALFLLPRTDEYEEKNQLSDLEDERSLGNIDDDNSGMSMHGHVDDQSFEEQSDWNDSMERLINRPGLDTNEIKSAIKPLEHLIEQNRRLDKERNDVPLSGLIFASDNTPRPLLLQLLNKSKHYTSSVGTDVDEKEPREPGSNFGLATENPWTANDSVEDGREEGELHAKRMEEPTNEPNDSEESKIIMAHEENLEDSKQSADSDLMERHQTGESVSSGATYGALAFHRRFDETGPSSIPAHNLTGTHETSEELSSQLAVSTVQLQDRMSRLTETKKEEGFEGQANEDTHPRFSQAVANYKKMIHERQLRDSANITGGIEDLLKQAEEDKKHKGHEEKEKRKDKEQERKEKKPVWTKVHRKYLLPQTLIEYGLPWDWDELDSNYIIVKEWIDEDLQEELFGHTRSIREAALITKPPSSQPTAELKAYPSRKAKMHPARKEIQGGVEES